MELLPESAGVLGAAGEWRCGRLGELPLGAQHHAPSPRARQPQIKAQVSLLVDEMIWKQTLSTTACKNCTHSQEAGKGPPAHTRQISQHRTDCAKSAIQASQK